MIDRREFLVRLVASYALTFVGRRTPSIDQGISDVEAPCRPRQRQSVL